MLKNHLLNCSYENLKLHKDFIITLYTYIPIYAVWLDLDCKLNFSLSLNCGDTFVTVWATICVWPQKLKNEFVCCSYSIWFYQFGCCWYSVWTCQCLALKLYGSVWKLIYPIIFMFAIHVTARRQGKWSTLRTSVASFMGRNRIVL
jgi:hypothetical protein